MRIRIFVNIRFIFTDSYIEVLLAKKKEKKTQI